MANILPVSPARASSGTAPLADRGALRGAVVLAVVTLAGFGFLYSLAGVGIGQALFPQAADGSLVERGSRIVGSALVAQPFAGERYFQPRPSAAGYDTMALTGSNQARTNPDLRKRLEMHMELQNPSASESQTERHIQDSKPDSTELEPRSEKEQGTAAAPDLETKSTPPTYPLGLVLRACPDIADYARDGVSNWTELIAAANLVRSALGVSPDAWEQAREAMGAVNAAISVAAILQRAERIQSPGGYLRSLTDKARAGQFSVGPLLMSLLRAAGRDERTKAG